MSLHSFVTRTDQGFLKAEVLQFWPCLFLFRRCCMHLQSYLMRAEGQVLWKKAEANHQRIADDWFCSFQLWHTHQLGCICRSNSCKQWKGEVTKCTLAGVQRPHRTALIACHLPEHKSPVGTVKIFGSSWPKKSWSKAFDPKFLGHCKILGRR